MFINLLVFHKTKKLKKCSEIEKVFFKNKLFNPFKKEFLLKNAYDFFIWYNYKFMQISFLKKDLSFTTS